MYLYLYFEKGGGAHGLRNWHPTGIFLLAKGLENDSNGNLNFFDLI